MTAGLSFAKVSYPVTRSWVLGTGIVLEIEEVVIFYSSLLAC